MKKMNSIGRNISKYLWILCVLAIILPVIVCFIPHRMVREISFEQINLRFRIENLDSTRLIHFGDKDSVNLPNYFETRHYSDTMLDILWLIIDNTEGRMEIKEIIFDSDSYYSLNIPDYDYMVNHYVESVRQSILDLKETARPLSPSADTAHKGQYLPRNYLLAELRLAIASSDIALLIFDIGKVGDIDSLIRSISNSSQIIPYSDLEEQHISTDYDENIRNRAYSKRTERIVIVTPNNKRNYICKNHWLFLDTMDISDDTEFKQVVWSGDSTDLEVIYKILHDNTPVPVNGILYPQGPRYQYRYLK